MCGQRMGNKLTAWPIRNRSRKWRKSLAFLEGLFAMENVNVVSDVDSLFATKLSSQQEGLGGVFAFAFRSSSFSQRTSRPRPSMTCNDGALFCFD